MLSQVNWISDNCTGLCYGVKIFDCRPGHGVLLRACDIEMDVVTVRELGLNENGFIDLRSVYNAEKKVVKRNDNLRIGRRVELPFVEIRRDRVSCNRTVFGVLKWIGIINKESCVGIELDYRCEGAMDGTINGTESFTCESGFGAVCPINNVAFDYYAYNASFTVDEDFQIESNFYYKEDWQQNIVEERNLKLNTNIFVYIEKNDRILSLKGVLKWLGYVKCVSVGILEIDDESAVTSQEYVNIVMKDQKLSSCLIVHSQYLFQYRTLKSYDRMEDAIPSLDLTKTTEFGTFKWRGVDVNDNIYYGFETDSPIENEDKEIFYGQKIFECRTGCSVLLSLEKIQETIQSKKYVHKETDSSSMVADLTVPEDDWMTLIMTIAKKHEISSDELVSTANEMDNKTILGPLVTKFASSLNLYKHLDVVNELIKLQSFDSLMMFVEKCPSKEYNDKQLLQVAAESLKFGNWDLSEKCLKRCANKDMLMDDGETFMTRIIKDKVSETLIVRTIESHEFDMSKSNKDNFFPLSLACSSMMMGVVECIVKYIKNQDTRKKVCSICMDKAISTVFNCGHSSCRDCSENISNCHICKGPINTRGPLYIS